jgi:hypothetical protein
VFLASCSSKLGPRTSTDVEIQPGRATTKEVVVNMMGLPSAMKVDEEAGLELWAYEDSAEVSALQLPYMTSMSPPQATVRQINDLGRRDPVFRRAAVVYTFNREGVLVHVDRRKKEGQ